MKNPCQPKLEIRAGPSQPGAPAPRGKPRNMTATAVARMRLGAYSAVSAIEFGIKPPTPMPVKKRSIHSWSIECASAVASAKTDKTRVEVSRMSLRPKRSASGPEQSAPIISPKRPATKTEVKVGIAMPHSFTITGAAKLIAPLSKPSRVTSTKHQIATIHWDLPKRPPSMTCVTLTV